MKYVLLVVGDEKPWQNATQAEREAVYAEWGAYSAMLDERGAARGGNELALSHTATTIRNGIVTDGPYAETAEQITGYMLVDAKDDAEALEFAKAQPGDVEIRPVMEYPSEPPAEVPPGLKYTLLLYGDQSVWENATPEQIEATAQAHWKFTEMLRERGAYISGEALQDTGTARTVRKKEGGEILVTDGPFAETAEQMGGYYEIAAKDLDEAIELAKAVPEPIIEVRPVVEYTG
ncbi:YciI family protein [Nonomuraea sp. NPDC050663]|uniref:YciI family protein n=1 Tax=Nonomuraea sp. NPDC050663 TaxID=3364370 RepID=UPI0037928ABF